MFIADVLDREGAETAARIGDAARYHHIDVSNEAAWHALVAEIVEQHGRLDVLVNNAAIFRNEPLTEMTEETYRRVIDINQIGIWLGMKAVGPQMIAQESGSVINVSSTSGLYGRPGGIAYSASKWAVRGMTRVAATEWGRYGIRVNTICPGAIDTVMLCDTGNTPDSDEVRFGAPIGGAADPSEVAHLALYLASDESRFCTGADFVIDGGSVA